MGIDIEREIKSKWNTISKNVLQINIEKRKSEAEDKYVMNILK